MGESSTRRWRKLERWSPRLFALAAACLFVGAANSGLAFLDNGYAFNEWLGIVLELGRLAALLGAAGLSVRMMYRHAGWGKLSRVVASLGVATVSVLIGFATVEAAGVFDPPIGVVALVAYVLSVSTFLTVGVGIVRTGAYSRRVGALLLGTVVALLVVFFGRLVVPLELVAAVVPAIQVLLYSGLGYALRAGSAPTERTAPATDTPQ